MGEMKQRPDLEPGFWPNYREPTPLARAIQYPLSDPNWQSRVLNGYIAMKGPPVVDPHGTGV